jgi:hypothetical protein
VCAAQLHAQLPSHHLNTHGVIKQKFIRRGNPAQVIANTTRKRGTRVPCKYEKGKVCRQPFDDHVKDEAFFSFPAGCSPSERSTQLKQALVFLKKIKIKTSTGQPRHACLQGLGIFRAN